MPIPIQRIVLSAKDAEILLEALENPPEPSEKLKAAAARYKNKLAASKPTKEQT